MGKKLFGAKGVFNEVFGAGRVSKREASAAGYALEEWGKGHKKRKRKAPKRRKAARKSRKGGPRRKLYGAALKSWMKAHRPSSMAWGKKRKSRKGRRKSRKR
jgi:hypothetical protein